MANFDDHTIEEKIDILREGILKVAKIGDNREKQQNILEESLFKLRQEVKDLQDTMNKIYTRLERLERKGDLDYILKELNNKISSNS